jgi:hypothetical protein
MRRQDLMFAILKEVAEDGEEILGIGTIEVLPDGLASCAAPRRTNYLAGPDDIYVSPNQVRKWGLRTGDTVEGEIRAPKDGERYFAITRLMKVNFDEPEAVRHRVNFDNLTPLYPNERLARHARPTVKDKSARVIDLVSPQGKGQRALDRGAAAHRQDRAAPEHGQGHHRQPSGSVPARAAGRRAPGRSDRHAAFGEGRGHLLDLRRTGHAPRRWPKW